MKKIALIGGARPNFMKVAPLCRAFEKERLAYFVINTGQHFDKDMSAAFFREFGIRSKYTLKPSRESTVKQFSDIMNGLEKIFLKEKPVLVVVVGDVNSTLAASLVAKRMSIKVAHVEAGLRSYNEKMPEETNRVLTDHISDLRFVTAEEGIRNLRKEDLRRNNYPVGNIMIDTLVEFLPRVGNSKDNFYFCTLHRAENIDNPRIFGEILDALEEISGDATIYLPIHPRTRKMAEKFGLMKRLEKTFKLLAPLSYKDSIFYQKNAKLVLTDSGGVQEETSFLGTPCITLRSETERPITVKLGTNTIGGISKKSILKAYRKKDLKRKRVSIPLWDGKASKRIAVIIKKYLQTELT